MVQGLSWSLVIFFFASIAHGSEVRGLVQSQGETTHVEFQGLPVWNYDLKNLKQKGTATVQLTLEKVDSKTQELFKNIKSQHVKSVRFESAAPAGKSIVYFDLTNPQVEVFEYQTDQPSRLILDFYTAAQNETPHKQNQSAAPKKSAPAPEPPLKETENSKQNFQRAPATSDVVVLSKGEELKPVKEETLKTGIFDGADPDFERFSIKDYEIKEEAILRSKEKYYIPFPLLWTGNEDFLKIQSAQPVYSITPEKSDENKMARLLLTLFERKRYSVYLKTLQWFREKYPESRYHGLFDYMTGDVLLSRWREKNNIEDYEHAIQSYSQALQKEPASPAAERTSTLLGILALERGDLLGSLRYFESHMANPAFGEKNRFSKQIAKLGAGFAYMRLFRIQEALDTFDALEKDAADLGIKVEAAYRKGDVFSSAGRFPEAIDAYRRAMEKYPEGLERFPNALFNQSEAYFQKGLYKQSLDGYRQFVKRYPNNSYAPLAMTRLGELLEIQGADPTRAMGAFLETHFRFGESPYAIIARLRLLSARMKGMKQKELENAVSEISTLAKKLDLPNVEQFTRILIADGYKNRGDYQQAIQLLTEFYQQNPTAKDLDIIKNRIVDNISALFRTQVQNGDFIGALKTHQKYADSWLKSTDQPDTQFYLGRAFEIGGADTEAEALYRQVLNRVYAAKGTEDEKKLKILEHLPSVESLNLRLAAIELDRKKYQQAYEYLQQIKQPQEMSETEQIERVEIAVKLLEQRGDLDSAARYLTELLRNWQGKPQLVAGPYFQLAQIELKKGLVDDALKSLEKIDILAKDSSQVSEDIHARALEQWGTVLLQQKKMDEAARIYRKLLAQYEEKRPLASIRYRLGKIQYDQGDLKNAAETWNEFKGKDANVWQKIASEELKNTEWQAEHKKYIQRIPAMAK